MDFKDKSCMVIAHPLFLELAVRLARDFGKVYFWNPGADATFPTMQQGEVGRGMEGVECGSAGDDAFHVPRRNAGMKASSRECVEARARSEAS